MHKAHVWHGLKKSEIFRFNQMKYECFIVLICKKAFFYFYLFLDVGFPYRSARKRFRGYIFNSLVENIKAHFLMKTRKWLLWSLIVVTLSTLAHVTQSWMHQDNITRISTGLNIFFLQNYLHSSDPDDHLCCHRYSARC